MINYGLGDVPYTSRSELWWFYDRVCLVLSITSARPLARLELLPFAAHIHQRRHLLELVELQRLETQSYRHVSQTSTQHVAVNKQYPRLVCERVCRPSRPNGYAVQRFETASATIPLGTYRRCCALSSDSKS